MTLREAAHALHAAGFRVQVIEGIAGLTIPAAGVIAPAGSLVSLMGTP
jgi:hypothetical protein